MSTRFAPRAGVTLAETVVVLGLAALCCAMAAASLQKIERRQRASDAEREGRLALRDGAAVLRSELQGAAAESVRVWGDTAVSFLGLVGISVVCARSDSALVLPPATVASGQPFTAWRSAPEAGDLVAAFSGDSVDTWDWARIVSADSPRDAAGCVPASGFISAPDSAGRRPVVRLFLDRSPSPRVGVGAPLQIVRRGRYVLHRGADRHWALAYRRCDGGESCGAAQPVVGPLASAADGGLYFSLGGNGSKLDVVLRAADGLAGAVPESLHTAIGLRNAPVQ